MRVDKIATLAQAARVLQCSPLSLQQKCKSGEIEHCCKFCGRWFINLSREWPVLFAEK